MVFTVVGLTEGIVSNSGDPAAFVALQDAQEIQFLKANEAVRNDRARLPADLREEPALAGVRAEALAASSRTPTWLTRSWSGLSPGRTRERSPSRSSAGITIGP